MRGGGANPLANKDSHRPIFASGFGHFGRGPNLHAGTPA